MDAGSLKIKIKVVVSVEDSHVQIAPSQVKSQRKALRILNIANLCIGDFGISSFTDLEADWWGGSSNLDIALMFDRKCRRSSR